jgi:hypothetical protein
VYRSSGRDENEGNNRIMMMIYSENVVADLAAPPYMLAAVFMFSE